MLCRAALICMLSLYFVFGESASVFAEKLMASEDIQAAQQLLLQQGFDPGLLTGTITPATSKALRKFQSKHHLKKTGELDRATQDELGIFVRMVESDPILGVTQEAREAATREAEAYAAAHPEKKVEPAAIRAKPTGP